VKSDGFCVVVDLEATCWRKGTRPDRMETIEIGAVRFHAGEGSREWEFSAFVRPRDEPQLSSFCTGLTSITQEDVDSAQSFPTVLDQFVTWTGDDVWALCSWGEYDRRQLEIDCVRHGLARPTILDRHVNLKARFAEWRGIERCGMKAALGLLGLELHGIHHRAIDDARGVTKIARAMLGANVLSGGA